VETADRIVAEIFQGFYKLADNPGSGHRRADLTGCQVLFYRISSYLVIYAPGTKPLQILGVLHGKRNVARILKERL
jgi:plasmid stabilization system protein ParE